MLRTSRRRRRRRGPGTRAGGRARRPGAELDPDAELARVRPRHRRARPRDIVSERCVVADLEQVDAQVRGVCSSAPIEAQRLGHPVGVLPEERVGAEADHERIRLAGRSELGRLVEHRARAPRGRARTGRGRARRRRRRARRAGRARPSRRRSPRCRRGPFEGVVRAERDARRRRCARRGGLGSPDRPDRLVRDDDPAGGRAVERGARAGDASAAASPPRPARARRGRAPGVMPLRSAAAVLAATTVSVSPNSRRRSAWPTSASRTPTSASSAPAPRR